MAERGVSSFISLLVVFLSLSSCATSSLYDIDDPLWELDVNNFDRIAFGKNAAWIIEFYSSWCGYCIRFAPHYKEFARDIENWKNVVEVGVVNCADEENTGICRKYNVTAYPTIKFFPSHIDSSEKGVKIEGSRELDFLRHSIINFLQTNLNKTIPSQWPALNETKATSITELWQEVPSSVNSLYVAVENPMSYVGREVMLDFSIDKHITMRRVLATNTHLLKELIPDYKNTTLVLVRIERDGGKDVLYTSPQSATKTVIRDEVFETVLGWNRVRKPGDVTTMAPDVKLPDYDGVYMVDIENAVHYALYQEVSAHELISGEKLSALKSFLLALKTYFPGTSNVTSFLGKLSDWINDHRGNITGVRFASKLEQLTTPTEYIPKIRPWVGCRGSSPTYRGYPCALWTLFHTLTVRAYENYQDNLRVISLEPQKILYDIRGYVRNFFSCEVCSQHFQQMSANLDMEAKYPRDSVLWLWQAHNKVNRRLAGDATEDPRHKKVQFPTEKGCKKCRLGEASADGIIPWEKSTVLQYMRYFYNKNRIRNDTDVDSEYAGVNVIDKYLNDGRREKSRLVFHLLGVIPFINYAQHL